MILILDNYDSFTYNLLHYVEQLTSVTVEVKRNDEITLDQVAKYSSIILSPGPGLPKDAGIMNELIVNYGNKIPILGVCLGLQAIGEVYGARLTNLHKVLHGVKRDVNVKVANDRLMKGLPAKFSTGHYHSWVIDNENFPEELEITATDSASNIMAVSHKHYPVSGLQFHPESIMTDTGLRILKNWIRFCDH